MFVNTNIFDPLEQFDIINYCTWSSNISGLMLFLFLIFIFFSRNLSDFYLMSYKNYFIKKLFDFVRVIVKSNIRIKKRYMFFLILLIFIYILFSNSIGLIPYTFTITSSLIVTFFIASMFFLGINIISAFTNG
jgi:F0F1-type ATP synthase membrane subunit a